MSNKGGRNYRKPAAGREKAPKVVFKGYLSFTPNAEEKNAYREAVQSGFDWREFLDDAISTGLNVKVAWDGYNQAATATLYCTDANSDDAGWTLSVRAESAEQALSRCIFVHFVILQRRWDVLRERKDSTEW